MRAAVLGANDGLVSTSSLMIGVATSGASTSAILTAGIAGLAAGAMAMAAGEYVSVSAQSDVEDADRVKEAAELVHVSLPAASRTVDDLVRRGFVERHEDPDDRRMKRVSPTEAGHAVIRRLNAARRNGLEQFTHTLTDTERRRLGGALSKLLERPDVAACRPEGLDS